MESKVLRRARLRLIMHYRGLNQKSLGKRLRVAPSTLSGWQNSPANFPDLSKLMELAKVLKVEVCWLAFGCPHCLPKEYHQLLNDLKRMQNP